jgi:hypothetical protein
MKINYHRYSNEEYQLLIDDIKAVYKDGESLPHLIDYIQGIIDGENDEDI